MLVMHTGLKMKQKKLCEGTEEERVRAVMFHQNRASVLDSDGKKKTSD